LFLHEDEVQCNKVFIVMEIVIFVHKYEILHNTDGFYYDIH